MKTYRYLWLILLVFAFTTCKEDEPAPIASIEVKDVVIEAAYTTADIQWKITCNASVREVILEYSTDSAFKNLQQVPMQKVNSQKDDGLYQVTVSSLTEATKYYARSRVVNKINSYASAAQVFETMAYTLPVVITSDITNVSYTTATCGGVVTMEGGSNVIEKGICYSSSPSPTIADNKIACGSGLGYFSCNLEGLAASTMYYVRAYAINNVGTSYGKQIEFTTTAYNLPTVATNSIVSNITHMSAVCSGEIISDGGTPIIIRGICYGLTNNPTISDNIILCGSGIGMYSCELTYLNMLTKYYIRAFATNSVGTAYGEEIYFTTTSARGALPGEFYVSATQKVRFSQGNLQYQASTDTWRFAENQYDYVGGNNEGNVYENNIKSNNQRRSATYDGWIDLFAWGTSGYDNTINDPYAMYYQPWAKSHTTMVNSAYNYYGYGPSTNMTDSSLIGTSASYDWGVNNAICNGGNRSGFWRVLTGVEWEYLIAHHCRGLATVNNVKGYILLPDNWALPNGINFIAQPTDYTSNTYSEDEWKLMESSGAVFFPEAIYNYDGSGSWHNCGPGAYWGTSCFSSAAAYAFCFGENWISYDNNYATVIKCLLLSVRLVQDVK